jgi:uncharacterized protein (TIGR02145 family)
MINMKKKSLFTMLASILLIGVIIESCNKEEENQLPSCQITTPGNGQEFFIGETITISVDASDIDGSIAEVRFFIDNTVMSSSSDFPYVYSWNTSGMSEGAHIVKVTAIDNQGSSKSDELTVHLKQNTLQANFLANQTSGEAPLTVNFTDLTTDNPTSWQWDFGDDGTSTQQNPTHTYNNEGTYTVSLTVTNSYGSDTEEKTDFITVSSGGPEPDGYFTDARDGQEYAFKIIGSQTWMYENLNYETSNSWWYENNSANGDVYGRLYTWEVALDACPDGWHLPSDAEWTVLTDYLGGESVAGGKMKEAGTVHWNSPNTGATNSSGFTALPGGLSYTSGDFNYLGSIGHWWSATEYSTTTVAWGRYLSAGHGNVYRHFYLKGFGFSVRCVRD